ncbi:MAG: T9SS type A sorting domain-containing protein [Bacteroidetes bacterium]|nr:T9SS type A sorting domain-containing protein [Bacteroidota bacterium]MCL5738756.1 T9SS type A sorting domain-containing protein [Bacteroidota bacterium]
MFKLLQNYPNPFNPSTVIEYQLPKDAHVSIRVYDILGREIATLVDGEHTAGYHEITFNGSRFASGVYFYRLTAPGVNQINKMLMIK